MFSKKVRWLALGMIVAVFTAVIAQGAFAQETKTIELLTTETDLPSVTAMMRWAEEFAAEYPDVKVVPEFLGWSDIEKRAMTGVAAGNPPHIIGIDFWNPSFAREGLVASLEDVIEKLGPENFWDTAIQGLYGKGYTTWAVPYAVTPTLFTYRSDLYQNKGLVPALTFEEHLENVKKLSEDIDGDGVIDVYGANLALGSTLKTAEDAFFIYGRQNGVSYFNEKDEFVLDKSPNLERMIETFEWMKERKKYAPPGVTGYAWEEIMAAYYTGKSAHGIYQGRIMARAVERVPEIAAVTKVMFPPRGPQGTIPASRNSGNGWSLMKNSKNPEIAKRFLEFITSGKRILDLCSTVPFHLIPPLKEDALSLEYMSLPAIKQHQDVYYGYLAAIPASVTTFYNPFTKTVHLDVDILHKEPGIRMVQRVVSFGEDPEKVIKEESEIIREILRKRKATQ